MESMLQSSRSGRDPKVWTLVQSQGGGRSSSRAFPVADSGPMSAEHPGQHRPSLLRSRDHRAHVTNVELFFDLVFVFAVTQLSHRLLEHLSLVGALQTGFLLFAVWWVW